MAIQMKTESHKPSLFTYTDYRKYLCDYYAAAKKERAHFSFRFFAKMAGFTSPNYLKLVMEGKRSLSSDGIEKFLKALKLKGTEARFFRLLVLANQASTPEERDFYTRQVLKTRVVRELKPLSEAQYDYYTKWYHLPLRELVLRSDFRHDPKWIADQFTPSLTEAQVRDGLQLLETLGLIEKNAEGAFCQTQAALTTGDEVVNQAVSNYHRQMIALGAEAIERFPADKRDISSLTVGVSKMMAEKIKVMIQDFRKELIAVMSEDKNVEKIMQINFQVFPLTKNGDDK
jgi:uncharacterized protein (TIGR02147 family)